MSKEEELQSKFQHEKEKDNIKRFNYERNVERERRKLEWKKLNVLAKEKLTEERMQFIKFEGEMVRKSMTELAIQQQRERDRVIKTMSKLKNTDFQD